MPTRCATACATASPASDVAPWLAPDEWERIRAQPNLPYALMLEMGADLALCLRERRIDPAWRASTPACRR
jgi:putative membrane protein